VSHKDDAVYVEHSLVFWVKQVLMAECINRMAIIANSKGVELGTAIEPPESLETLIKQRSLNEIYMLSWQVITNFSRRDLRLLSLDSAIDDAESDRLCMLFAEVESYHTNYLRSQKKITPFRLNGSRNQSALSLLVSR